MTLIMSALIFQLFYLDFYNTILLVILIVTVYGFAAFFIGKTSLLFATWYKHNHKTVILLYFISISFIVINLIFTAVVVCLFLFDRPQVIGPYVGGNMDLTGGSYKFVVNLLKISSIISFLSMWVTTVVLSYTARNELLKRLRYLVMPIALLVYFGISYFSQNLFSSILSPLQDANAIFFLSALIIIFALIKPAGGIMFGISF